MTKKEKTVIERYYSINYVKYQCCCDLYDESSQMYNEVHYNYNMLHNLMRELGYTELEIYELEKMSVTFI